MLGSQGTTSVHWTWCSEGEAGRHLRTKAGHAGTTPVGQGTPSPEPIPLRLERIATQAQQYPDMNNREKTCWSADGDG